MATLPITGFYGSLLALFILFLAWRVVKLRFKNKVGLLDGGIPSMTQAIRIHGNAIEYVPLALILFACAESQHVPVIGLHILGISLLLARVWHAYGLSHSSGRSKGRFFGTSLTWVVIVILGLFNIYCFVRL